MSPQPRFLTLKDVADVLNVSSRQVRTLLLAGDLRGIQVGGRCEWRIEHDELENYISRQYERTEQLIAQGDLDASPVGSHDGHGVEHHDA